MSFDEGLRIREEIDKTLVAHSVDVNVVMEFDNFDAKT